VHLKFFVILYDHNSALHPFNKAISIQSPVAILYLCKGKTTGCRRLLSQMFMWQKQLSNNQDLIYFTK